MFKSLLAFSAEVICIFEVVFRLRVALTVFKIHKQFSRFLKISVTMIAKLGMKASNYNFVQS